MLLPRILTAAVLAFTAAFACVAEAQEALAIRALKANRVDAMALPPCNASQKGLRVDAAGNAHVCDGTNWNMVNTSATVYGFRYTQSRGQSIAAGTVTIVDFDVMDYDDTGGTVTTGAAWKFTVPVGMGGLYFVSAQVTAANGFTDNDAYVSLFVNGSERVRLARAKTRYTRTGATVLRLNDGDYLDVRFWIDSAFALEAFSQSNSIAVARLGN